MLQSEHGINDPKLGLIQLKAGASVLASATSARDAFFGGPDQLDRRLPDGRIRRERRRERLTDAARRVWLLGTADPGQDVSSNVLAGSGVSPSSEHAAPVEGPACNAAAICGYGRSDSSVLNPVDRIQLPCSARPVEHELHPLGEPPSRGGGSRDRLPRRQDFSSKGVAGNHSRIRYR